MSSNSEFNRENEETFTNENEKNDSGNQLKQLTEQNEETLNEDTLNVEEIIAEEEPAAEEMHTVPPHVESNRHYEVPKNHTVKNLFIGLVGGLLGAMLFIGGIYVFSDSDGLSLRKDNGATGIENTEVKTGEVKIESDATKVVKKVAGSVVGIVNIQNNNMLSQSSDAGIGSGVIYKTDGKNAFIVTNHHVVEGANKLDVSLNNGDRVEAKLLGSDIYTDLAVVTIPAKYVKDVAEFGSSATVNVGEPALAIGNPLDLKFSGSVTQGIISGVERTVDVDLDGDGNYDWQVEVLQTDAAINPGNSGGALVNMAGQVIGINSMKINQNAVEGIGFAIPIDIAKPIIDSIEKYGEVRRPYMGVQLRSVGELSQYHQQETLKLPPNVTAGVVVLEVVPGSPAEKAGLKAYDVIYELDGKKTDNVVQLRKILYTKESGDELSVKYYRNGKTQSLKMKLTSTQD